MKCRFLAVSLAVWLFLACSRPAEKITWEFGKHTSPADIGWHPKDNFDLAYAHDGDIDFTFIEHGSDKTRTFHQRCWSIGAFRRGDSLNHDVINGVYAHFANEVTVEEGIEIARKVLIDWDGGLRDPPAPGNLTLDQYREEIKNGTYYHGQFGVQGRESGVVTITLNGPDPPSGLKRKCTLTFAPG